MIYTSINLDGRTQPTLNVSGIVGFGGQNRRDDVIIIQGFFNYIAKGLYPGALGLGKVYKVPEITGIMDGETSSAIVEFQIRHVHVLLTKVFDGRIHPANYKNRKLHTGVGKRYMAITYLHLMATDAAVTQGHHDYIQAMANMDSELARIIDMAVISQ